MDAGRFDRLAKVLRSDATRRRLVTGLGASILTGRFGFPDAAAKRKRQVSTSAKKCRQVGAPCEGKQAESCCAGLVCSASDRGSARRCTPCASQGSSCASDEACCGELVCSDTGQCGCPAVACQGGNVNQDTCACECPTGFTPVNGECLVQTCTSGVEPLTACDRGNGTKGYCCCIGSSICGFLCSCCPELGGGSSCSLVGDPSQCPGVPIGIACSEPG